MTIGSGDILKTVQEFTLNDGTICQNVFHHERHGLGIITDGVHLTKLEEWIEDMYAEIAGMVKNDAVAGLMTVDIVEWVVDAWEVVENIGTRTPTITFTGTQEMLPNMDSAFATFKTARPRTVGRKYLLPFEELWQAGSYLLAGAVTDMVAWANWAVNNVDVSAPLDYLTPGVPRTAVNEFLEFNLAIVTNVLGTQRRRRPGVGA